MLAGCHHDLGNLAMAREWLEKGLGVFPHDPELLFRAGVIYRDAGDFGATEQSYLTLLSNRDVGHIDSLDVTMTGYKAHHNLALLYQDMGRLPEAERAWRAALTDHPRFTPSWMGLAELCLAQGRWGDVRSIAETVADWDERASAELLRRIPQGE
jgi:tetratricopeptide (TPR) repeat protein